MIFHWLVATISHWVYTIITTTSIVLRIVDQLLFPRNYIRFWFVGSIMIIDTFLRITKLTMCTSTTTPDVAWAHYYRNINLTIGWCIIICHIPLWLYAICHGQTLTNWRTEALNQSLWVWPLWFCMNLQLTRKLAAWAAVELRTLYEI